ncbi:adenosine receptor A3-like [Exaiptasia diaphana]|uniref:G-protein coupled receptors family 1 profile domain-containing protein n=1 Tax=Exaiptasia diaphana TaxID=2652724 RepID=A0A913YMC6_EXADI|nr:adenosine receptor A3-like [Exaiptasia diaphana]
MKKWYKMMLVICWGTGILPASLRVIFPEVIRFNLALIMMCGVVMIGTYAVILYKVKRSHQIAVPSSLSPSAASERAKENRMSGTIAIIVVLFAACWIPLVAFSLALPQATLLCKYDMKFSWTKTLMFANSSMNFIVYSLRIRQFRAAYMTFINRMLQPFGKVVGKCFRTTPIQQNNSSTFELRIFHNNSTNQEGRISGCETSRTQPLN